MPQVDTLSSSLDAMEKGTLYHSDETLDDSNHSSSPPIPLSARIPWFDATRNQHTDHPRNQRTDPSRNQHTDPLQCPTQSKMSKPFVNVPEDISVLSKSSIVNRPCISYQNPDSTLHHLGNATQRPGFIDDRTSRRSFQRTDASIQQQNVSIGFSGSYDNRPKSDIQYPIQLRNTVIRHGSNQLPERCTNRPENDRYSRSSSIPHPSTVTPHGSFKLPGRSVSCPDSAICQEDIPRISTDQFDHAYGKLPTNTLGSTSHINYPAAIPRRPTQRQNYLTNRPENGIYSQSAPNHRVEVTIPPQNNSIQRPQSVIAYSGNSLQRPKIQARHPGYAIPSSDISSRSSECFTKNSDNFGQRAECSIIQMF